MGVDTPPGLYSTWFSDVVFLIEQVTVSPPASAYPLLGGFPISITLECDLMMKLLKTVMRIQ